MLEHKLTQMIDKAVSKFKNNCKSFIKKHNINIKVNMITSCGECEFQANRLASLNTHQRIKHNVEVNNRLNKVLEENIKPEMNTDNNTKIQPYDLLTTKVNVESSDVEEGELIGHPTVTGEKNIQINL